MNLSLSKVNAKVPSYTVSCAGYFGDMASLSLYGVAGGCSLYKWRIGSVELRTGEFVARMRTLEMRRQSGAVG